MRLGIAKVNEHPVTTEPRDETVKLLDRLRDCLLIGADHLAHIFRIELA